MLETGSTAVKEPSENLKKTIWSVAGGKGGTGKSVIAANLGIGMALIGYDVILIDGDLGVPNLHNYLRIKRPEHTLDDFLSKKVKVLSDVIIDTPLENLRFISGAANLVGIANLHYAKKQQLIRHINKLKADVVIVDLGAGITFNTIDFFNMSSRGIVVSNPEPNANQDAYFFLKNALYRRMMTFSKSSESISSALEDYRESNGKKTFDFQDFRKFLESEKPEAFSEFNLFLNNYRPRLIMNKIRSQKQGREGPWFISLVKLFLDIEMEYLGGIKFDKRIIQSSEKIYPFIFQFPGEKITKNLFSILDTVNNYEMHNHSVRTFKHFRTLLKQEQKSWI